MSRAVFGQRLSTAGLVQSDGVKPVMATKDPGEAVGRSPDRLTLEQRIALAGKYIALEIYTPENLALRRIEAIGDSAADCMRMLQARGLDPKKFEFSRLTVPW